MRFLFSNAPNQFKNLLRAPVKSDGAMGRGPLSFKGADLTRALVAVRKAGITVERARIERDGKIVLDFATGDGVLPEGKIVATIGKPDAPYDGGKEIVL